MREKTLKFLGLMRRASALQAGENNAGEAVRGGKAKLLLLASDAGRYITGASDGARLRQRPGQTLGGARPRTIRGRRRRGRPPLFQSGTAQERNGQREKQEERKKED